MKRIIFVGLIFMFIASPAWPDVLNVELTSPADDGYVTQSGVPFPPLYEWEDICLGNWGTTSYTNTTNLFAGRRLVAGTYSFWNTLLVFDVPIVPGEITGVVLRLYVQYKGADNGGNVVTFITTENLRPLGTEDYRALGFYSDGMPWNTIVEGQYNHWGIPADSCTARQGGIFPFLITTIKTLDCVLPPAAAEYVYFRSCTHTSGSPPILRITYIPTPPAGAYRAAVKTGADAARLGKFDLIKTNERSEEP